MIEKSDPSKRLATIEELARAWIYHEEDLIEDLAACVDALHRDISWMRRHPESRKAIAVRIQEYLRRLDMPSGRSERRKQSLQDLDAALSDYIKDGEQ